MAKEILKQPLHTTIAVDTLEFGEFSVEEELHIVISVKDFKSIIAHAGNTSTTIKSLYSHPSSPMQITYSEDGLLSEFILMTIGESGGSSATPAANGSRANSKRPASRPPSDATSKSKRTVNSEMPPPMSVAANLRRDTSRNKIARLSPPLPQPSLQSEELFLPGAEEDKKWDPAPFDEDEDDVLLWDAGGASVSGTKEREPLY